MLHKQITDFCSVANSKKTISIDYIDCSDMSTKAYIKSRYECCLGCDSKDCPLYENALKQI